MRLRTAWDNQEHCQHERSFCPGAADAPVHEPVSAPFSAVELSRSASSGAIASSGCGQSRSPVGHPAVPRDETGRELGVTVVKLRIIPRLSCPILTSHTLFLKISKEGSFRVTGLATQASSNNNKQPPTLLNPPDALTSSITWFCLPVRRSI